jgi:hypothetical protein
MNCTAVLRDNSPLCQRRASADVQTLVLEFTPSFHTLVNCKRGRECQCPALWSQRPRTALGVRHSNGRSRNLVIACLRLEHVVPLLQHLARCCPLDVSVWTDEKLVPLGHQLGTEHEMPALRPSSCFHALTQTRARATAIRRYQTSEPCTLTARRSQDCDCVDDTPAIETVPCCSNDDH